MHRQRLTVVLLIASAVSAAAAAAGGNLVTNGGFEAGGPIAAWTSLGTGSSAVPGWRVSSGSAALVGRYWNANSGTNSLEVGSPGAATVEQTIATAAGRRYRLTFVLAGNPEGPPRVKTLVVSAGSVTRTFTFDSAGRTRTAMGWTPEALEFTAASGSTTLRFSRLDGGRSAWYGPAIDDVTVTEANGAIPATTSAPEPTLPVVKTMAPAPVVKTMAPAPVMKTPAPAPVVKTPTPAPAASGAARTSAASGAEFGGLWVAAYPGKAVRVYVERRGSRVAGNTVDGSATIPTGTVAFTGRVDGSPIVVLGKCADADARGWHGSVIEWSGPDAFRLRIANCHASDILYTRWRAP